MTIQHETRAPFAAHTTKSDKARAGRTGISETQLELRSGGNEVDAALRAWVYERLGRQLGKYAPQIERIQVRFGDENGPKGGHDKSCMIHVILSKLPPVVVDIRGDTEREAFDLAADRIERATRRNVEKHGFSTKLGKQKRALAQQAADGSYTPAPDSGAPDSGAEEELDEDGIEAADGADGAEADEGSGDEQPMYGRREGHRPDQLLALQARPEKERRDVPVDTSEPGTSATDRKVGAGHTAKRNTKLNTAGMAEALEDSTNGQPSRKSTRGSTNHIKKATQLTLRTKSAVQSPKERATRG